MSVKIGIITILRVNNYGAELQAYATQKALQLLGYQAEIIDYLFYKNPAHIKTALSAPSVRPSLKKRIKEFLFPLITKWKTKNSSAAATRSTRFGAFHRNHTRTSKQYRSYDELKIAKLDYDVLISGSDQIWNPGNHTSLDPYFLRFGEKDVKRIAYASSFGVSQIPENARAYYQDSLNQFAAIGVREDTAVDMVRNISEKTAVLVLDPTLLLTHEQWLEVSAAVDGLPDKPYILIYELGNIPYIKKLALHFSECTGMPVVRICQNAVKKNNESQIINIIDAGPAEFLHIFDKAGMVLTNSFHGSAFSINFGKPFFTIVPKNKRNNSRQISLLKLFNCESKLIMEDDEFPQVECLNVDNFTIEKRLKEERLKSVSFLMNAIYD